MQKWCLGCNFIVANTQLSLFYLEIFVARLLRGGVLQNNNTDNQRVIHRNNPTKYTIVMDTHGHLQWKDNAADGFPLLCIMSEDVTEEYLQALRNRGISWISTGKGTVDLARAMQLAHERFSIERIAVVGGGHICGGFLSSGLVDEVSAMVAPGIDGRKGQ